MNLTRGTVGNGLGAFYLTDAQWQALQRAADELERHNEQWGDQSGHSPDRWYCILGEEVGEVAHAINERDAANYRDELADTAAVAINALASDLAR